MKIFKDTLGISSLEGRISLLENRVEKYETALETIASVLKQNSKNVVELSRYIREIIDAAGLEVESRNKNDVYH